MVRTNFEIGPKFGGSTLGCGGYSTLYLEGDYTASLSLAKEYEKNKDIGRWNTFSNNCAQYTHMLLKEGKHVNPNTQKCIESLNYLGRTVPAEQLIRIRQSVISGRSFQW